MSAIKNIIRLASAAYLLGSKQESVELNTDPTKVAEKVREQLDREVDSALVVKEVTSPDWSDSVAASLVVYMGHETKRFLGLPWDTIISYAPILYVKNKLSVPIKIVGVLVDWTVANVHFGLHPYTLSQYKIYPNKTQEIRLEGYNSKDNSKINPFVGSISPSEDPQDRLSTVLQTLLSVGGNAQQLNGKASVIFALDVGSGIEHTIIENIDCIVKNGGEVQYKGYSVSNSKTYHEFFDNFNFDTYNPFVHKNEISESYYKK